MKPSIFRKNLILIISVVCLTTLAFIAIAIGLTDRLSVESSSSVLSRTAGLAAASLQDMVDASGFAAGQSSKTVLAAEIAKIAGISGYRVTVVGSDGSVIADSDAAASSMDNHGQRPEIAGALKGKPTWSVRLSKTTKVRTLYAAVPLSTSRAPAAAPYALRLALPLPQVFRRLLDAQWIFILFFAFVSILSIIVSVAINRQIAKPVGYILDKAGMYAGGKDLEKTPSGTLPEELRLLDDSLDTMVAKIRMETRKAEDLGKRYSSILEAAGEGVIAADSSLKILEANTAVAELFSVNQKDLKGKSILEALGSRDVAAIFRESLEEGKELYREIHIFQNGEKHVKIHTTALDKGGKSGVVAVFSDISGLKRLEAIRKDFVANVSHELRTPIQIIRGYAEILGEGNIDPDTAKKYLALIEHNSQRMEQIVGDLLTLARLENDPGSWLTVEDCDLGATIKSALSSLEPSAAKKHMEIDTICPEGLRFTANSGLIEQALVNLIDNALNYSPDGSRITVKAATRGSRVDISVADKGSGIPPADLSHIFERFYRVDKSRSKSTGGTGLGLAIVRHIAVAHDGEIRAESYVNEGSVFTLSLPLEGPKRIRSAEASL